MGKGRNGAGREDEGTKEGEKMKETGREKRVGKKSRGRKGEGRSATYYFTI